MRHNSLDKLLSDNIHISNNAIILIQSYPNLINAITILEKGIFYEKIKLWVINNSELFKLIKKIVFIYFKDKAEVLFYNQDEFSLYSPFEILKNKIKISAKLKTIKVNNFDVFFSSIGFTTFGFSIIKKIVRIGNNNIIHIQDPGCDVYTLTDRRSNNLKELIILLIHKFIYGKELCFGYAGKILNTPYFFKISESFINKNVNLLIDKHQRMEIQDNISISSYSILNKAKYKIVYFDKDMVRDGLCEPIQYKNDIEKIFKCLLNHINPNELIKKYKPLRSTLSNKSLINYGIIAEDYIPAEMLYSSNVKIYLGITSMAMSNIKEGIVISIVNLIQFHDEIKKNRSVDNLEKRKKVKNIFYPRNINEFEKLIKKYI